MAASLLRHLGLPELVTDSAEAHEALIIALAQDDARRAALRDRLVAAGSATSLFDTTRFTRHLEAAFATIHDRRLAGLAPGCVDIF